MVKLVVWVDLTDDHYIEQREYMTLEEYETLIRSEDCGIVGIIDAAW